MLHTSVIGQKYDFNWIFGYDGGKGDPKFGTTKVDFNSGNPIQTFIPEGRMIIFDANASISTEDGRLLYYTNGYDLEDSNYVRINKALDVGTRYWDALICNQGVLFIPINDDSIDLFYVDKKNVNGTFYILSIKNIVLSKGQIIKKNVSVIDTINEGFLTICRHANGNSWWLILNKLNSNVFYSLFINNENEIIVDTQVVGPIIEDGLGQAVFSNNGEYLALIEGISFNDGLYIYLYKFDRCLGKLYFVSRKQFPTSGFTGISFSPNSKFLYYSQEKLLYQFDMSNTDPLNYPVLIDTITDQTLPWGSQYDQHQLGPDGRIYITNLYSNFYQHVINKPNESGKACDPRANGFMLKTLARRGISNNPNYRLGPIDGSICDSLGIDNMPWAWWRYDQDTLDYLKFEFTDLSAYEVTQWDWSFGDGASSTEPNPTHRYKENGIYNVCLIVRNINGVDTLCRQLHVGVSSTTHPDQSITTDVFPNPASDYFIINVLEYIPARMFIRLYDTDGRIVLEKRLYEGSNGIDVSNINPGIYTLRIQEQQRQVYSGRMAIVRE
ncbi:MAG: PKD domain-containing protein [Saprospiraceae bacterium]